MTTNTTAARLRDIADRLARLAPCHRDPHQFHEEKSELVAALRKLAANDNKPKVRRTGWL